MNCPACGEKLVLSWSELGHLLNLKCEGEDRHPYDDVRDLVWDKLVELSFFPRMHAAMLEAAQKVLDETPLPGWVKPASVVFGVGATEEGTGESFAYKELPPKSHECEYQVEWRATQPEPSVSCDKPAIAGIVWPDNTSDSPMWLCAEHLVAVAENEAHNPELPPDQQAKNERLHGGREESNDIPRR
jgi:hypothetical protein